MTVSRRLAVLPVLALGAVLAALVRGLRLVRSPRPIHAHGLVLEGAIEPARVDNGPVSGIAWIDEPTAGAVEARLSRGIGVPIPVPDLWGLAFRQVTSTDAPTVETAARSRSGDLLLASLAGPGPAGRFVPFPRLSPWGAAFGTVMPYRSERGPVLVAARTVTGAPASATRAGQAKELARRPWVLDLVWASPRGRWNRFASLTLSAPDPQGTDRADLRFDPVLSPPSGARTYSWTRALRKPGYRAARGLRRSDRRRGSAG